MTLTQAGIDYICQNFGNVSLCCANTGLEWYYTSGGSNYPESGGTAQIVSRLASGLVDTLTMTNPARGSFTQTELNNANGGTVTLTDAQSITSHDEPSEDQWCYTAPPDCVDYTDQTSCINAGCYWYNGSCHSTPPSCSILNNETDCLSYGCYWYSGSCHSDPEPIICSNYTNQTDCEANGCYWWSDNSCHDSPEPGPSNWTQSGIDYICQNFGDTNLCCVETGLTWSYYSGGTFTETGGTAQIVSRLASGLVDYITMISPPRGQFTQTELNNANGTPINLTDAQAVTAHDSPSEDQWCYLGGVCSDYTNQNDCETNGCYWWNGTCHDSAPTCTILNNEADCLDYGCYWYDNSCHSDPYVPPTCGDYTNQIDCVNNGCYWWSNNTCHSTPETTDCEQYLTQIECVTNGCYWWNNSCHSDPYVPPYCEDYTNAIDCIAHNCYWYDSACHSSPPPTCADFTNKTECENAGCYWWNNRCNSNPPMYCSDLTNEIECLGYGCYWYDGACHASPQGEIPYWWWIPVLGAATIIGIVYVARERRKNG